MIPIKSPEEIKIMHTSGRIAASVRKQLVQKAKVGVTTKQLDGFAENLIQSHTAQPSFKNFQGFPASIVTCINEEVVHGIPSSYQLKKGDVLTIDLGVFYRGFHTDTATSILVDTQQPVVPETDNLVAADSQSAQPDADQESAATSGLAPTPPSPTKTKNFLRAGQLASQKAINKCQTGNYVGDISFAIQKTVEQSGYNVIRAFVGHGIGKDLHEPPQIPCFGQQGTGEKLTAGMTLAVEVMYTLGKNEVTILKDGWTAITKDGKISGMFEHTVAVTEKGPLILTG